jgi:outer membrane protein OmpA-like peptidoglycan-associated protein
VAQFASQSELSRFQQTASAGATSGAIAAAPAAGATGGTPAAVVLFAGDGTTLDATARAKIHEIADAYRSTGAGFVRVVGHSSSRTPNMPVQQHAQLVFQRSQDRANAVAHELIRDGVPVAKVLVEAVGDSQPIYYESMPKGEEGNRRAEIFLQS